MRHGQQPRAQRQRAQELDLAAPHHVLRDVAVPELVIQSPDDHWIGLRENLQETMVFTTKYRAFL